MYSVLHHEEGPNKPPTPQNNNTNLTNNYEIMAKNYSKSMHFGVETFNNKPVNSQQPKVSMQQLYKNQLDQFMQEKEKQRKAEKEMIEKEKEEYRERVRQGQ